MEKSWNPSKQIETAPETTLNRMKNHTYNVYNALQ